MKKLCAVALLAVLLVCSAGVMAQVSTSSVTGTVMDKSGAVIAGARVIATNEGTGVAHETRTTDAGVYTFSSLVVGSYSIRVEMQGFQKWVSTKNVMNVGSPLVVNATLEIGALTSVVTVESSYQRLETSNSAISAVITENQVKNLPLNGRNPLSLLTLEPGVVQRSSGGAGSGVHVFGSRDRAHNVTIDGIDANESTVPNPQGNIQRLNPDNVQEFRSITLGATAENGRNSGANVMVATKSGSNEIHGSAYYFNRNTALAANEYFNNAQGRPRPDLKLNQWGFDVGGPIWKNKTFFFGSYQGNNIKQSAPIATVFGIPTVYTATALGGIYRFVRGTVNGLTQNSTRLVDSSGSYVAGVSDCNTPPLNLTTNCIDSYNIFGTTPNPVLPNVPPGITSPDPAVAALLATLPTANNFSVGDGLNTAGYAWNPPTKFAGPHIMVRVDHNFGAKDNLFVRWLQNRFNTTEGDFINSRPILYPGFPPLGEVTRMGKNLSVSYRRVFTPALVNELTVGFNRFAFAFTFGESNPDFGDPSKVPIWADSCIYGSFGNIGTGTGSTGNTISGPYCVSPHTARAVTTPQVIDNVSWSHGAHTIRGGINFRFYYHNDSRGFFGGTVAAPGILFNSAAGFRRDTFNNFPTGMNSSDSDRLHQVIVELAGIPYSIRRSFQADFIGDKYVATQYATVYTRAHQYNSYIMDEWKLRPNLVLNLGVRWEFNPSPFDKRQSLVPNRELLGTQGPVSFVKAKKWFANDNITAIAPRVGLAWSPDNKTAVRVGYALLFDTISTFQVTAIAGKMPGFMLACNTNTDTTGAVSVGVGCVAASGTTNQISSGFPVSVPAPTTTPSAVAALLLQNQATNTAPAIGAFDQNMKNPAVHQWNLSVQRELPWRIVAEVGYIGKRGTHLQRAYDINQVGISPQFLSSFIIARGNLIAGCDADGTVTGSSTAACATAVGSPTFLTSLVTGAFLNTQTTNIRRGGVGDLATSMDGLASNSSSRTVVAPSASSPPSFVLRPNGQYGQIFYQDSGGDSWYRALYFSARRRFEKGLDFGLSYTLSRSVDMLSADPTAASTGGNLSSTSFQRTPTDVRNFALDKSRSDFNNTHVWQGNVLYDLPFGKGRPFASNAPGWLNQIIGGWTVTSVFVYQSGEPYTLSSGTKTVNGSHVSTGITVGPRMPGSGLQPSPRTNVFGPVMYNATTIITVLTDPHLNCLNVIGTGTYFCIPPPGQNGEGRNTMNGLPYWNLDAGLLKVFDVTERIKVQFRLEAFNVLNHPNFENPRNSTTGSATVTSSAFGQTCCATAAIASAQQVNPVGEPMRVVQLGLKLNF